MVALLAIGAIALTNSNRLKFSTILFCFVGDPRAGECTGSFETGRMLIHNCDGVNEKACAIVVDESQTPGSPSNRTLKPGFVINLTYNDMCGTYYVVECDMVENYKYIMLGMN